ncbi:hypothetical protein DKT68_06175 [Micromonospora acroterricola]|uniref:Secreted protein n=1 Tax=Micromonospora acroterricola TaxID=2202421 RepID=A0A317DAJ3_9ACTN|nr:hypothetical protein [Micromonospora acroterricola]PWR11332.1 hypothetical protein DKT68_06175 [Micromonospora acroterricola]
MVTAAVVMTAAAVSVAAPAVARTPTTASVLPFPWEASYGGATASGTQTVQQDPLGVGQKRTVKGIIQTGTATGCFHVQIQYLGGTWESPVTCAGESPESFVTTFQTYLIGRPSATARLCAGTACGTPTSLW